MPQMIAYQTAAFAYQGAGQLAYQDIAASPAQVTASVLGSIEGGGGGGFSRQRRSTYKKRDSELIWLMPIILKLLRRK